VNGYIFWTVVFFLDGHDSTSRGDLLIAPATGFACNAASLEAMTGQVYLAVVIARLVGLHAIPRHAHRRRWTA